MSNLPTGTETLSKSICLGPPWQNKKTTRKRNLWIIYPKANSLPLKRGHKGPKRNTYHLNQLPLIFRGEVLVSGKGNYSSRTSTSNASDLFAVHQSPAQELTNHHTWSRPTPLKNKSTGILHPISTKIPETKQHPKNILATMFFDHLPTLNSPNISGTWNGGTPLYKLYVRAM